MDDRAGKKTRGSAAGRGFLQDALLGRLYLSVALIWVIVCAVGCTTIQTNDLLDRVVPTNDRAWVADMQRLSTAEIQGEEVLVKNIRNCQYVTSSDYIVNYYERKIRLSDLRTVDFIVVPFKTKSLAHTMLSFGLADGSYLCVSAEIRKELGENYSPLLGVSNQFELYYLVADERDVIRLRTRFRDAEVYVYPTVATPENARELFLDVMRRANQLAMRPEFYHTVSNNCTTNIVAHVNKLQPQRVPFGWQVLLSGNSAKYAYDLGLLDNRLPFEELKELARVNDLAEENFDAADFSQRIRSRHQEIADGLEAAQSEKYEDELSNDGVDESLMETDNRDLSLDEGSRGAGRLTGSRSSLPREATNKAGSLRKIDRALVGGTKTAAKVLLQPPKTPGQLLLQTAIPGSLQARSIRLGVGVATEAVGEIRQIRASHRNPDQQALQGQ